MQGHARVVVIGGGAMGVSLLYHLTKLGWNDVVLIEKNELTAGSTWHAAGLCTHFAHNLTIQAMRAHSIELYSGILEIETGSPVGFHQTGALRVTRSKDRMDEFRQVRGIGKYSGIDFQILTPSELKDIYPLVELDGLIGAIHEPLDGHVDPSQATHAMAKGARNGGANIHLHTRVTGIARTAAGEWRVETNAGDIVAEHVVNAAGTWGYEVGRMFGLELPVVPMLHQYLVTDRVEAVAAMDRALPIIRDPEESWYVRQERDGLIVGPYEKAGKPWSIDAVPPDFGMELLPPDLDSVEHIVAAAMARIPALGEAGIKTVVTGPITFTPDANPLIGPAFGLDNAWLLTGTSMGVMEGGGAGKFLAEWIVDGEPPMDAVVLDPRRFGGFADRAYRIAKAIECFGNQFAVHYPYEEREAGRPGRTSAIHDDMAKAGAVFGAAYGWERPNWFARKGAAREAILTFRRANWFDAVGDECRAASERVAVADLSVFAKFEVTGADALSFMDRLGANRVPGRDGQVGLTHALTPRGGIASEFAVTRLAADRFYLTSAAAAERHDLELLQRHVHGFGAVTVSNLTSSYGVLGLMGPHAPDVLSGLVETDLSPRAFPWLSAQDTAVGGVPVRALRLSYIGEAGWEMHVEMHHLKALYDAIIEAGRRFDIGGYGAYAMNAMRLEKGYRAWGMDLSTERTPFEAGLDRLVTLEGRRFTGRDALAEARSRQPAFRMELLEIEGEGPDPFGMHPVFRGERVAGLVTSGVYGHRTGKKLALAYLRPETRADEAPLRVEICGLAEPASILPAPPFDPANHRMKNAG